MGFYLYSCKKKLMLMKKALFVVSLFAVIIYSAGCKKCYTCKNSCVLCAATYNGHTFTQVLCNDSFSTTSEYNAAIAADTSLGYRCTTTTSTYNYDFCVNKPGEQDYPAYFDHGGRAPCVAK
jgi:hypothetical protein